MESSAAIYVRQLALDDREGDNRSLGAQERECRAWAEREGLSSRSGIWERGNLSLITSESWRVDRWSEQSQGIGWARRVSNLRRRG